MPNRESPLEHALQQCSFYPLLLITAKVLSCSGFGDVQIMDRRVTTEKTRFGGFEIQCVGSFAGQPLKTVVKVIPDAVRLRMLDENAGAVIRTGADLGLVVSPFHLTRGAAKNLKNYHGAIWESDRAGTRSTRAAHGLIGFKTALRA
jgi:hypothetical protein